VQVNILTENSKWRPGKPFCLSLYYIRVKATSVTKYVILW